MEDSSWLHVPSCVVIFLSCVVTLKVLSTQNIVFEVNESYKLHANILCTLFVLIGT